jgi:hypothetical protein
MTISVDVRGKINCPGWSRIFFKIFAISKLDDSKPLVKRKRDYKTGQYSVKEEMFMKL